MVIAVWSYSVHLSSASTQFSVGSGLNVNASPFRLFNSHLLMTDPTSRFFRNKRMWIGFAIAAGISLFNGLSHLYPVIPHIPVTRRFFSFHEAPLSLYGTIITAFYPFAIGIMFLMPLDVLFSTTLFYFLYRNEVALAKAVGWSSIPRFPYLNEQTIGAFVGLCFFFGWTGKRHFSAVLKSALPSRGREPPIEQHDEPMPYRVAVWGFVLGILLFAFLLYKAGMAPWLAITFAVLFLITPLVTTRIRAESGIFVHAYHWQAPRYILNTILGTHRLGARNLAALSVCFFNRDYRPQQMPHQLEAFKIAELANINQRRMLLDRYHRHYFRGDLSPSGCSYISITNSVRTPATLDRGHSVMEGNTSDG